MRSVFIIDPKKKVRLTITYPASTGRNFDEILRVIDFAAADRQLQRGDPGELEARRGRGDRALAAGPRGSSSREFPKGYKALKPYLRMTPQPNR